MIIQQPSVLWAKCSETTETDAAHAEFWAFWAYWPTALMRFAVSVKNVPELVFGHAETDCLEDLWKTTKCSKGIAGRAHRPPGGHLRRLSYERRMPGKLHRSELLQQQ